MTMVNGTSQNEDSAIAIITHALYYDCSISKPMISAGVPQFSGEWYDQNPRVSPVEKIRFFSRQGTF